jgi:Anti-sigma-K factor rskA
MTPDPRRARLEELLGMEATQKLTSTEESELDALLAVFPHEDPDGFELAAAAVHLALIGAPEEMPPRLAEKLHLTAVAVGPSPRRPRAPRPAWTAWAGWAIAAGLAWLLLYTNWPKLPPAQSEPTFAQKREELLKDKSAKTATAEDAKTGAAANVVWSTEKQEGYLEVHGLKPNDPTKEQYQLWIVDPTKKQPVDGGVFDVKPDGTALVRVRAPIIVKDALAFAVTKETAGGVVVSDGPMLLVLKPKPG